MSSTLKQISLWILVGLLLASCATPPPPTTTPAPRQTIIGPTPAKATRTSIPIPTPLAWKAASSVIDPENAGKLAAVGSLPGHIGAVNAFAFAHQKPLVATRDGTGNVIVWNIDTGALLFKVDLPKNINQVIFTADDTQLATTGIDGQIRVFNVASGKEESAVTGDPVQIVRAVGSPDGSGIYFIGAGGAVSGWRPATGRSATFVIPPRANTKPLNLSVSPDGKLLAVLQEYGTITLYDALTGARLRESKLLPEIVQNVEFSPDSNLIAVSRVQTIYTFNVSDLSQRNKLTAPIQSADRGFQFSPDSRMIAVNGKDYVLIWNTDSGFEIARLPNHPDGASGIAWSPDGKLLATVAFGDKGGAYLWDVSTFLTFGGGSIRQGKIAKAEDEIFTAAWSPKGNQLLLGNIYGTVFVWGIAGS